MTGLIIGILDQWHNKLMIYSAVDLGVKIDFGPDQPGAVLQRKEKGYWHDCLVDGKPVVIRLIWKNCRLGFIGWWILRKV